MATIYEAPGPARLTELQLRPRGASRSAARRCYGITATLSPSVCLHSVVERRQPGFGTLESAQEVIISRASHRRWRVGSVPQSGNRWLIQHAMASTAAVVLVGCKNHLCPASPSRTNDTSGDLENRAISFWGTNNPS